MVVRRTLFLVVLASVCALVTGLLTGVPPAGITRDGWELEAAAALALDGALWVDGRSSSAYAEGHYPGALHLNEEDWDAGLAQLLGEWNPGTPVIVYCDGEECESSRAIAGRLRAELGETGIYWLVGGWQALQAEGGQ